MGYTDSFECETDQCLIKLPERWMELTMFEKKIYVEDGNCSH